MANRLSELFAEEEQFTEFPRRVIQYRSRFTLQPERLAGSLTGKIVVLVMFVLPVAAFLALMLYLWITNTL